MSILRVTVIRLHETPKYLLGKGRDEEVVQWFRSLADKYGRPCSLTVEQLQACGVVSSEKGANAGKKGMRASIKELGAHFGGLFATRKMGLSTSLVW